MMQPDPSPLRAYLAASSNLAASRPTSAGVALAHSLPGQTNSSAASAAGAGSKRSDKANRANFTLRNIVPPSSATSAGRTVDLPIGTVQLKSSLLSPQPFPIQV